jgi:hypothetical protein
MYFELDRNRSQYRLRRRLGGVLRIVEEGVVEGLERLVWEPLEELALVRSLLGQLRVLGRPLGNPDSQWIEILDWGQYQWVLTRSLARKSRQLRELRQLLAALGRAGEVTDPSTAPGPGSEWERADPVRLHGPRQQPNQSVEEPQRRRSHLLLLPRDTRLEAALALCDPRLPEKKRAGPSKEDA